MRNMKTNPVPAKFNATLLVLSGGRVRSRLDLPLQFSPVFGLSVRRRAQDTVLRLSSRQGGLRLCDVLVELPSSVRPFFGRVYLCPGSKIYLDVAA